MSLFRHFRGLLLIFSRGGFGKKQKGAILMLVIIRGAGDIASGVALRLFRAGVRVIMTETAQPTAIRRTVCFSEAVRLGEARVEGVCAVLASGPEEARMIAESGNIAVIVDEAGGCIRALRPDAVVDAILAKRNCGLRITDAPVVIAVGPGFTAGVDCHAVVETMRGHTLGRVITEGSALPNTGVPGIIGGYGAERVLRAPKDGVFRPLKRIGELVSAGETVAEVDGEPVVTAIGGVLRGILPEGTAVTAGMKSGDVDPRGNVENCDTASDKALAVGGGVLEALLMLTGALK